uniref:ERAP1-like C-terminal domain-containing protein n=1 Tax=Plectus sambesii TaxID=2011161 RepID=A0A914XI57_9BILA
MYLNQYNQSNVVHQQLYDAWQGVVNNASVMGWNGNDTLNVTDFMTTWINYPGFPLLTVARDPSSDHIIVSQERFLLGNPSSAQNYHYRVPLWYWNQANNQTNMAWLNMDTPTQIPFAASNPFILLNPQGIGYYRVNYDANNWNQLITAISQSASLFDLRARSQLIDDAFAIARTDKLNYSVPFQLVGYLPTETSWIPWSTAMTALQYIGIMLSRTANYGVYQTYTRGLITNAYNNINFAITPDDVLQNNYNLLIAGTACNLGISACVNRFNASFSKAVTDCVNSTLSSSCNSIPANEREVAYCTGVRVQGAPAFNYLMQIYSNETDNMERVNIINGLACANEGWLVQSLLDACLNQGIVQSQTLFVYRKLAYNPVAVSMMAEYLITNWNNPVAQDDELVLAATRNLNTNYELSQLTGFAKNALNGDMLLSQVAVIQANVQWMNMYASDAVAAMQTYTIKF